MRPTDGNQLAAEFIATLEWDKLPESVQRRARLCLLDGFGAVLAGSLAPVSRIAGEYAVESWGGDAASVFRYDATRGLHRQRASAAGAAFANACSGNALDIDDDAIFTRGHPGAQLIPAALAVAEKVRASGKEVLEALVAGYEIAIRAGRCWHHHHSDYQADGSWGSVACAAAAARLLRLDEQQIGHALGIAEYHAPNAPMMRDIADPTMAKHAIGWGAMTGVTSAELAARGYTGMPGILGFEEYRDWVSDLGSTYWMADWVFYKSWASCAWGHAACMAAQQLVFGHHIDVEDIAAIRVRTFEEAAALYRGYPRTTEEAQFSVAWPLACLLLDGEIGPRQVLEDRFSDPRVRSLVDKIEIVLDPEIDAMYKATQEMDLRMHSAVEITLGNGLRFDSGMVERAADRYSASELVQKFRQFTGQVLPSPVIEHLVCTLAAFETVPDFRELLSQL